LGRKKFKTSLRNFQSWRLVFHKSSYYKLQCNGTMGIELLTINSSNILRRRKSCWCYSCYNKVEKNLKGSLDSIPSPSTSVKIQIMGGKVCLRCKGKTLLGFVNRLLKKKVCWYHPAMFCLITSCKLSHP
jgi:hypothetical protein